MYIHEHTALLMAKERLEDAMRYSEQMRAIRLSRPPRLPGRVRLGMALIRLGRWMMNQPSPASGPPIGLGQAQS